MLDEYDESYRQVFRAAFDAGVRAAQQLSDAEVETLRRYSGVVGLIAEHVALTRKRDATRSLAEAEK